MDDALSISAGAAVVLAAADLKIGHPAAWYYYYTWHDERSEEEMDWEDINTVQVEESELVEGDALYLRFAGCSKQIRRFETYTGPFDFVSRIARFVDGTGMSLEKGHYYRKLI